MNANAVTILEQLDARLHQPVALTLYGRAAIQLGFDTPPPETILSRDVDAVLYVGQAEALLAHSNFWDALQATNAALADRRLYLSHLFEETQVILRPDWRTQIVPIPLNLRQLSLSRLATEDLLLSKLMRDDPQDYQDACFLARQAGLNAQTLAHLIQQARIPAIPEIHTELSNASRRLADFLRKGMTDNVFERTGVRFQQG